MAVAAVLGAEDREIGRPRSAVNSIVTGAVPRGISLLTLNFLISMPCTPSADRTARRDALADRHFDLGRLEGEALGDDLDDARLGRLRRRGAPGALP